MSAKYPAVLIQQFGRDRIRQAWGLLLKHDWYLKYLRIIVCKRL